MDRNDEDQQLHMNIVDNFYQVVNPAIYNDINLYVGEATIEQPGLL